MVFTQRRFGHIYDVVVAPVHYTIKSDSNQLRSGSDGVVKTFRCTTAATLQSKFWPTYQQYGDLVRSLQRARRGCDLPLGNGSVVTSLARS